MLRIDRTLLWAGLGALVAALAAPASAATLPLYAKDNAHIGVANCASSTCHGAVNPPVKTNVLQNEFITWQKRDKHARAYDVLTNEVSKRMARNLGLDDATTADVCLDCHSDNVPQSERGAQFLLSDGVGCEACHGGGQGYLGIHIANRGHQANLDNGLYPTADPAARAELCLSCHFGDNRRFVTHRLYGAGHPRISFELDTFTAIQPAHFVKDEDYQKRKAEWIANGVQTWAIGQAMALSRIAANLADPGRNRQEIAPGKRSQMFPELTFFDCNACHHKLTEARWVPQSGSGLQPGLVRLNDANLVMLRVIANHFDPGLGERLLKVSRKLHAASQTSFGDMEAAAKEVKALADQMTATFSSREFGSEAMRALYRGLVKAGLDGTFADYSAAEQAAMALGSVIDALREEGGLAGDAYEQAKAGYQELLEATKDHEAYDRARFRAALQKVSGIVN